MQRVERQLAIDLDDKLTIDNQLAVLKDRPASRRLRENNASMACRTSQRNSTSDPALKARQRNPSHLGSYCHAPSSGRRSRTALLPSAAGRAGYRTLRAIGQWGLAPQPFASFSRLTAGPVEIFYLGDAPGRSCQKRMLSTSMAIAATAMMAVAAHPNTSTGRRHRKPTHLTALTCNPHHRGHDRDGHEAVDDGAPEQRSDRIDR